MKDPKEEASHRILNLKNMMRNVKEDEKLTNNSNEDDLEEDEELIRFLNERRYEEEYEMNDYYIYHPRKDSNYEMDLNNNEIDENYIIKTNIDNESDEFSYSEKSLNYDEKIGENFDNIVNMKIHKKPVLAMVSLVVGVILIIFSVVVLNSGTDRIIDNVVSGENNYITVVLLIFGLLLIIYGIFKLFNIKSPFHGMMESMENIDENNSLEAKEKFEEPAVPESNILLDKESFKIGEFNINELKSNLRKPFSKNNKVNQENEKINVEELPLAREKSKSEKGLIKEEIEEKNYKQAKLDGESIDEIFSEVKEYEKRR